MNAFVDSLTTIWNVRPVPTEFYLADDQSDIMRMRGFDFYVGEGYNRGIGGVADITNRMVFGAGQNEFYPHEFVHIYVNPLFPKAHNYFLEGYAALLGGSRGHDLRWHVKRINQYLEEHPEIDSTTSLSSGILTALQTPSMSMVESSAIWRCRMEACQHSSGSCPSDRKIGTSTRPLKLSSE